MKRLIAISLCLMFMTGSALASGINLDGKTFEELMVLRREITAKLDELSGDRDGLIGPGVYLVGVDIKAGVYEATNIVMDDVAHDGYIRRSRFRVYLYQTMEDYENRKIQFPGEDLYVDGFGNVMVLNLKDGLVMSIDGSANLRSITPDWLPQEQ